MKGIVNKLPYGLKAKWHDVADKITEEQEREINVEDIANFVSRAARAATHPVFGNISSDIKHGKPIKDVKKTRQQKATSFATQASFPTTSDSGTGSPSPKTSIACPMCESKHWLSQCDKFKKMTLEDRQKFVRSAKLCNNCLVHGHYVKACLKKSFCKIEGCGGKHSTYLHPKLESTSASGDKSVNPDCKPSPQASNGLVHVCNSSRGMSGAGSSKISMPILPVKVKAEGSDRVVDTYAFLDSG